MLTTGKPGAQTDPASLDTVFIISVISLGLVLFPGKYLRWGQGDIDKEPLEMAVPSVS